MSKSRFASSSPASRDRNQVCVWRQRICPHAPCGAYEEHFRARIDGCRGHGPIGTPKDHGLEPKSSRSGSLSGLRERDEGVGRGDPVEALARFPLDLPKDGLGRCRGLDEGSRLCSSCGRSLILPSQLRNDRPRPIGVAKSRGEAAARFAFAAKGTSGGAQ
jgi:hypothetical protein